MGIGLLISILAFLLIFLVLRKSSSGSYAERKGRQGERYVTHRLDRYLRKYKSSEVLHDLILQTPDGTTQIDHLLISPFGLFVIETKNLSGWIFGDTDGRTWTQVLFKEKHKFQNPLKQNFKHEKAIQRLIGVKIHDIHSVVVFAGNSTFKTELPVNVVTLRQLLPYLKSFHQPVLNDETVESYAYQLRKHIHDNPTTLSEHINNVTQNQTNPHCPRCGSSMVLRTAKKGNSTGSQFWGCSNFPKCRGIRNLK